MGFIPAPAEEHTPVQEAVGTQDPEAGFIQALAVVSTPVLVAASTPVPEGVYLLDPAVASIPDPEAGFTQALVVASIPAPVSRTVTSGLPSRTSFNTFSAEGRSKWPFAWRPLFT